MKGLLLSHIRSITTSPLKVVGSGGIVSLSWDSVIEKVEHEKQFWDMFFAVFVYSEWLFWNSLFSGG